MKIAVMVAMTEELHPFKEFFKDTTTIYQTKEILIEKYNNSLYFVKTGIGPILASMATTLVMEQVKPDLIINSGTTGALSRQLHIGDIILSDTFLFINDTHEDNFYSPYLKESDEKTKQLLDIFETILTDKLPQITLHRGTIASTHVFMKNMTQYRSRINTLHLLGIDMESAAISEVATYYNVPVINIRAISDFANHQSQKDFANNVQLASQVATLSVTHIINQLLH